MKETEKKAKPKEGTLVEKHGFAKVMSAFLAVPPKAKKKPVKPKKQKRRDLKK